MMASCDADGVSRQTVLETEGVTASVSYNRDRHRIRSSPSGHLVSRGFVLALSVRIWTTSRRQESSVGIQRRRVTFKRCGRGSHADMITSRKY